MAEYSSMKHNKEIPYITSIISSCKKLEDLGYGKTGTRRIVRETIHFIWETGIGKKSKFSKDRLRSYKASKENKNSNLRYDHPVPLRVIIEMIFALDEIDEKNVELILLKYIKYGGVLITTEEDKTLNNLGLQSEMPGNWDKDDIFARYKLADIEIIKP